MREKCKAAALQTEFLTRECQPRDSTFRGECAVIGTWEITFGNLIGPSSSSRFLGFVSRIHLYLWGVINSYRSFVTVSLKSWDLLDVSHADFFWGSNQLRLCRKAWSQHNFIIVFVKHKLAHFKQNNCGQKGWAPRGLHAHIVIVSSCEEAVALGGQRRGLYNVTGTRAKQTHGRTGSLHARKPNLEGFTKNALSTMAPAEVAVAKETALSLKSISFTVSTLHANSVSGNCKQTRLRRLLFSIFM